MESEIIRSEQQLDEDMDYYVNVVLNLKGINKIHNYIFLNKY